jgi:ATP-dependent DNA ligase
LLRVQSTNRCLAFRDRGQVVLQSRHGRSLTRYFPEIVAAALRQLPEGTVVDGELVIYGGGRCDFTALQRRIHPAVGHVARLSAATPASFVLFDVLAARWKDLRGEPWHHRRKKLRRLLVEAGPPLALMPTTRQLTGAQAWMRDYVDAGVEGVVVKHCQHGYRPQRGCWWKVRTRTTADAVVGGVIGPLNAPQALLLGLPDEQGRLRVAGRTRPLTLPARRELGALLVPPERAHPWPGRIASSRFGQLPGDLVDYTPTAPLLVVEVDADVCFEHERWRHATTFRRVRVDMLPADLA